MNVTFLVYADNAVYQICTPTVKSHGPDKGGLRRLSRWQQSQALPTASEGMPVIEQSEAFQVPM